MDTQIKIKEEQSLIEDTASQNEIEAVITEINSDVAFLNVDCDVAIKTEPKSDSPSPDFCSQKEKECFTKHYIKSEPLFSSNCELDMNTEIMEQTLFLDIGTQNEREFLSEDHEMVNKLEIKEEPRCLETETSSDCNDIKDGDFPPVKCSRLYIEEVCRGKSDLFPEENSGNNGQFNAKTDNPEYETARKSTNKDTQVAKMPSMHQSVYSDQLNSGCLKYSNFVQQNNIPVHSLSKKKYCNESVFVRQNIDGKFQCEVCDKMFISLSDLKTHNIIHESNKPYKCDICGKCFTVLKSLKIHQLAHEGIKPYMCDHCGKNFTRLQNLKTHKLIHEGIQTHKCDHCGKCFTRLGNLETHKLTHGGIKPHKCDICGKCFAQLRFLKSHKLTHESIKPHKCDICGKCFNQLGSLKSHKLTHEGLKPHTCDVCSKNFTRLGYLNRHKLTHESIKPHKCDICGKCFTQFVSLKSHKLIHEGIRPHKCDICGKCFTQLGQLNCHKLTHEGIKSCKCDICGKYFANLVSLKRHKLIHEGIKPHKCDICGKYFTQLGSLKHHKLTHYST